MESNNSQNSQGTVAVNATEIIRKYKNKQDRINFCLERNWLCPTEPGYDSNFFLLVLMGRKKYLPNNFAVNYELKYFRSGEKLGKSYIIGRMMGNPAYSIYTPDNIDPKKFSKKFLLTLISYLDPQLFQDLYSIQKKRLLEKTFNNWGKYRVDIKKEFLSDIKSFNPVNENSSRGGGGFRLSKNHQSNNTFYQPVNNSNNRPLGSIIHLSFVGNKINPMNDPKSNSSVIKKDKSRSKDDKEADIDMKG